MIAPKVRQPDITVARSVLGWEPQVPLREGLERSLPHLPERGPDESRGASALLEGARAERFANRDYYGALLCLDDESAGEQGWADVFHLRGVCFSLLDRHAEAVAAFDRAIAINPRYLEAHLHRALALTALGREADAAVAFAAARESVGPDVAGLSAPVAARLANEHAKLGELYAEAGAVQDAVCASIAALRSSAPRTWTCGSAWRAC